MFANKTFNTTRRSAVKLLLLAAWTQLLIGCSESDMSDLQKFVAETKSKYVGQVEPLPVITPYESYSYEAFVKRDPFRASVAMVPAEPVKRTTNGVKPSTARNREELEKYPLNSLQMVGVLNNDGQNWAIIKAPDSSIFRVRKGNYMGENHGKIISITEGQIDLKEIVADGTGGWTERKNKITLSE